MRKLDEQTPRVETGTVQFGDDWPGLFIRGDDAGYYAMILESYLKPKKVHEGREATLDPTSLYVLNGLQEMLVGVVVGPAKDLFRLDDS